MDSLVVVVVVVIVVLLACFDFNRFRLIGRTMNTCAHTMTIITVTATATPFTNTQWADLELTLVEVVSVGTTEFTRQHSILIAAAFKMMFDVAHPAAGEIEDHQIRGGIEGTGGDDDGDDGDDREEGSLTASAASVPTTCSSSKPATEKAATRPTGNKKATVDTRKAQLKQSIYMWNQTDADDESDASDDLWKEDPLPYGILSSFVRGLAMQGRRLRRNLENAANELEKLRSSTSSEPSESRRLPGHPWKVETNMQSFWNCVSPLLYLAEMCSRRLPENKRTLSLCARVARALLETHMASDVGGVHPSEPTSSSYMASFIPQIPNLIAPDRYADSVLNSTKSHQFQLALQHARCHGPLVTIDDGLKELQWFLQSVPATEIADAVQSMFARDLVDLEIAGFGVGDFLVWLKYPVTATNPLLFFHSCNYPFSSNGHEDERWQKDEVSFHCVHTWGVCACVRVSS